MLKLLIIQNWKKDMIAVRELVKKCTTRPKKKSIGAKNALESRRFQRQKNPNPKRCNPGPGRGVAAGQLQEFNNHFSNFIQERNMYYVSSSILIPLTKRDRLSFAEVVGPDNLKWFISHFWGTPFSHFLKAVTEHAKSRAKDWRHTSYWICKFSNNHHHHKSSYRQPLKASGGGSGKTYLDRLLEEDAKNSRNNKRDSNAYSSSSSNQIYENVGRVVGSNGRGAGGNNGTWVRKDGKWVQETGAAPTLQSAHSVPTETYC